MKKHLVTLIALACSACASTQPQASALPTASPLAAQPTESANVVVHVPTSVPQAGLLLGVVPPGSALNYGGRAVRVSNNGRFVIGVSREQTGNIVLHLTTPNGDARTLSIAITPRSFPIEHINGVPPETANPSPDTLARIKREQAEVDAVRKRDDDRSDFDTTFIWPVKGRISGLFGSQRVYNGTPGSPHPGVDVAAAKGTPIHAPAGGIVTFADNLFLSGGTVLIDHGHGVSSNLIHMSRIDVKVGERVEQGQVVGLVGATGRATGPHMHWGMNWFDVRVDPQLLMPPGPEAK
jgi:murein DD-endopeptidase MepM/ murein hydrolase activator NlpD